MFEKASRLKLRFSSPKGLISVEDLWDLPLTSSTGRANLDDIAKGLYGETNSSNNVSFVTPDNSTASEELRLKFDLVKYVIGVRLAENEAAKTAKNRSERKQQLMAILHDKENETLRNSSVEEIRKMLETL